MTEHNYGNYLTIDLWCEACNKRYVTTLLRVEATYENRWDCPECSGEQTVKRIPSAPNVMRASYPTGYKRAGFQEMKEAAALQVELAGLPGQERAKAEREIDRLEQRTPKK